MTPGSVNTMFAGFRAGRRQVSDFALAKRVDARSVLRLETDLAPGCHDDHFRLRAYFEEKVCGSGLGRRDDQTIARDRLESGLADFNSVSSGIDGVECESCLRSFDEVTRVTPVLRL